MFSFKKLADTVEKIKKYDDVCIIVEGKKDKEALKKLDLQNILDISGKANHQVIDIIEQNNFQNIIILTDFDGDGVLKASQLTELLEHHRIHILPKFRKIFNKFNIHKIEELKQFTKFMEDDYRGKTSSIYNKIFNRSRIHNRWNDRETRRHRSNLRPDRRPVGARS